MTADNFTKAARAEAERRYIENDPDYPDRETAIARTAAFAVGAEWARTHLAEQEPTDAEVEAAAAEAYEMERCDIDPGWPDWQSANPISKDSTRAMVRAVFRAARAARRDEEKR